MATPNRAQILNTAVKVLKKHYSSVEQTGDRSVLEYLIYALCLENAPYEKADEAFARLQDSFFDWNEVRVTTVTELSEVCRGLPNRTAAAGNIRRALHSVFESQFTFDLEPLRKENLGKTVKELEKHEGITPFAIGYVVQHGLGGHAIPVDDALIRTMLVLGVITPAEAEKKTVPGLERAIPKSRGIETASLLHHLAADYYVSSRSPRIRSIVLEINPEAKERLPKRSSKKRDASSAPPEKGSGRATKKGRAKTSSKKVGAQERSGKSGTKKPAKSSKAATPTKKKPAAGATGTEGAGEKKKLHTRRLSQKKPR